MTYSPRRSPARGAAGRCSATIAAMPDPYRDSDAPACPRCRSTLVVAGTDFTCPDGCGSWLPHRTIVALIGDRRLGTVTNNGPYWRATALPLTRCLVCRRELEAHYPALERQVLTIGDCPDHGAWIEAGDRAAFERAYASTIANQARSALGPKPTLANRVAALERRVAELEAQLRRR